MQWDNHLALHWSFHGIIACWPNPALKAAIKPTMSTRLAHGLLLLKKAKPLTEAEMQIYSGVNGTYPAD